MKKILMKAMMTSISEVMETMFFLPVEFDGESTLSGCGLSKEKIFACRLGFNGDTSGSATIVAPKTLAAEMAENFMGEAKKSLTDEHFSGTLTELCNIVCGNALSKTESKIPFELSIPELINESEVSNEDIFNIIETTVSKMAFSLEID
ncbi:MAG: chemotaxis protein CheX [Desulfobacteraceae bacterium]|nr:chemotaxis protein CheX [Desulfobacteraceae bacterium]